MMRYGRKDIFDKFYTDFNVAKQLVSGLDLTQYQFIIEPSAGDGAFVDAVKPFSGQVIAIDISPGRSDITKQDFFEFSIDLDRRHTLIIGNPPFGKQNSLALKFLSRAMEIADTVAFVLPMSFNKNSVQNKVCLNFNITHQASVPESAFRFEGSRYDVPTTFQVWKRMDVQRAKKYPELPIGWQYCRKEEADLSIRRVGFRAGRAELNLNKNEESHLFIKLDNRETASKLVEQLNSYLWKYSDTVGPRTVSKYELNKLINSNVLKLLAC